MSRIKLDKFYTKPEVAKKCIEITFKKIKSKTYDLVLEPSAGNGSFYNQISHKNLIGLDLEPECKNVIKQDFFTYEPSINLKILTIGNPPFGKRCKLAVSFFNHAAIFSNTIAFIIPRTFRRSFIQNKLNLNFHLLYDTDIDVDSFVPKTRVKSCFQIWVRKTKKRKKIILETTHPDFDFVKYDNPHIDFAVRSAAVKKKMEYSTEYVKKHNLAKTCWLYIKSNIGKEELKKRFDLLDLTFTTNTSTLNQMGKGELIQQYKKQFCSVAINNVYYIYIQ